MSLGAEDSAFDAGNPPDASEKAKYEKKNSPDLTSFSAILQLFSSTHTFGTGFRRSKREPKPKPNHKPKPQPKPRASVPKPPPKRTKWEVCGACDSDVVQTSPCVARRGIGCDRCGVVYHLDCVGKVMAPKYGSYICVGCKKAGEH